MSEQNIASERLLNETAIREHALRCSILYRAGKFTRVGQEFIDEVQIDVENLVRGLRGQGATLHPELPPAGCFTTGALLDKIQVNLNALIGRIIQNKVQKQPSCGVTLGRTR